MASSKKLTEEQLTEGLFTTIMKKITDGNIQRVGKALEDIPSLKKAAADADKAAKRLKKSIARAQKSQKAAFKGLEF